MHTVRNGIWGFVAVLVIAAIPARAADVRGDFSVRGLGLELCSTFVAERIRQSAFWHASRSWLNGYLTAYNQLVPDTYDVTAGANLDALDAAVAGFCDANPDQSIAVAATSVVGILDPGRTRTNPSGENGTAGTDNAVMRRIQEALKSRGHYKGAVDGLAGPGTSAGIEAFQRAQGLPVTRLPDTLTLTRLLQ